MNKACSPESATYIICWLTWMSTYVFANMLTPVDARLTWYILLMAIPCTSLQCSQNQIALSFFRNNDPRIIDFVHGHVADWWEILWEMLLYHDSQTQCRCFMMMFDWDKPLIAAFFCPFSCICVPEVHHSCRSDWNQAFNKLLWHPSHVSRHIILCRCSYCRWVCFMTYQATMSLFRAFPKEHKIVFLRPRHYNIIFSISISQDLYLISLEHTMCPSSLLESASC